AWPAARMIPPMRGGSSSACRDNGLRGEASTGAVTADRDDLGEDRERDLLDARRADVQADRRVDARDVAVGHGLRPQPGAPLFVGRTAADRADVARRAPERGDERGMVELIVVCEDRDRRARREAQSREAL